MDIEDVRVIIEELAKLIKRLDAQGSVFRTTLTNGKKVGKDGLAEAKGLLASPDSQKLFDERYAHIFQKVAQANTDDEFRAVVAALQVEVNSFQF